MPKYMMPYMTDIKLSIVCLTYNHIKFIRQALQSFVMQKTTFDFEVIVHDDASTDGTTDIIREFAEKYPSIIKPVFQTENQWSKGISISKTFVYPKISGEYVALCEGDDYFIDENKLQKQVDFLEAHPDYAICFHPVLVHWDDNRLPDSYFPTKKMRQNLTLKGLLDCNFIQTNSVVYRWRFHRDSLDLLPDNIMPGDWFLHLMHAETGKIGFIDEVMSVYRRNAGGIWTGVMESDDWFNHYTLPHLHFCTEIEKRFHTDMTRNKLKLTRKAVPSFLHTQNFDKLKALALSYPDIYQQVVLTFQSRKKHSLLLFAVISLLICLNLLTVLVYFAS